MASIALREAETLSSESVGLSSDQGPAKWFTLRRSGKQPLRFRGTTVAEATGHSPEGRLWHELNIFRRQTGGFILDLRVFKKDPGQKDVYHVHILDSMGEVISFLEEFDPRQDVPVNVETGDQSVSTAELTLKAVALRQQVEEAERDYRSLVGDLLYQIEMSDPARP